MQSDCLRRQESPIPHLVLSPHLDDAALSCGATIAWLSEQGDEVKAFTVFAGDPAPPLSPFAHSLHQRWGAAPNLTALRRAEDAAALTRLGASIVHGSLPDAIYRRARDGSWLYADDVELFSAPSADEAWIEGFVADGVSALVQDGSWRLYAPLAIGGHVDHQIVHAAGCALATRGFDVSFYEDFPYAIRDGNYRRRLAELPGWRPDSLTYPRRFLDAKIDACLYYRSQLDGLFADDQSVAEPFINHSRAVTPEDAMTGERFWRPP